MILLDILLLLYRHVTFTSKCAVSYVRCLFYHCLYIFTGHVQVFEATSNYNAQRVSTIEKRHVASQSRGALSIDKSVDEHSF